MKTFLGEEIRLTKKYKSALANFSIRTGISANVAIFVFTATGKEGRKELYEMFKRQGFVWNGEDWEHKAAERPGHQATRQG